MKVREGEPRDINELLRFIKALAVYEKEPEAVEVTEEILLRDGFGPQPLFRFLVVEDSLRIIRGVALFYHRYSTWKGKTIHLEDIIVEEAFRGMGYGKVLFEKIVSIAAEENCGRMEWQVLKWNEPAINFYQKYGALLDGGWYNGILSKAQLEAMKNT